MKSPKLPSRRNIIKAGLATAASAAVTLPRAEADKYYANIKKKEAGETKIVLLGGDYLHNGFTQEFSLRGTFYSRYPSYRFIATADARYITPELLSDADLFIIIRWGGPIHVFCPEIMIEHRPSALDGYMSSELEALVVDQVKNRGMGLMCLHCTCWNPEAEEFTKLMGIKAHMHGPVQKVHFHRFNQTHPVTKGMAEFDLGLDENFGADLVHPGAVELFRTTGQEDGRNETAGWCVEQGKGRVVGIVAGHTWGPWWNATIRELHWRGAHWAMKRDIPPFEPPKDVMPWAESGY